jgi:hypothetical protein
MPRIGALNRSLHAKNDSQIICGYAACVPFRIRWVVYMRLKSRSIAAKILLQRRKYEGAAVDEELDDLASGQSYRVFLYPEERPDYEEEEGMGYNEP